MNNGMIVQLLHTDNPIHYDLIMSLFNVDTLEQLLQDRYANYVVSFSNNFERYVQIQAAIFTIQPNEVDYVYKNLKEKINVLKFQGPLVYVYFVFG